jgi:hypothetical protein
MNTQPPKSKGKVAILAVAVALLVIGGLGSIHLDRDRESPDRSLFPQSVRNRDRKSMDVFQLKRSGRPPSPGGTEHDFNAFRKRPVS